MLVDVRRRGALARRRPLLGWILETIVVVVAAAANPSSGSGGCCCFWPAVPPPLRGPPASRPDLRGSVLWLRRGRNLRRPPKDRTLVGGRRDGRRPSRAGRPSSTSSSLLVLASSHDDDVIDESQVDRSPSSSPSDPLRMLFAASKADGRRSQEANRGPRAGGADPAALGFLSREELQVLLSDRALRQNTRERGGPPGSAAENPATAAPVGEAREEEEPGDSTSVALDADEYLAASASAASLLGGTVGDGGDDGVPLDGPATGSYNNQASWDREAARAEGLPGGGEEGPYAWDPAYRTALEALLADPVLLEDDDVTVGSSPGSKARSFTVQDLKRALEKGSVSSAPGPRSAPGDASSSSGIDNEADLLHARVLEGEEGFLRQSRAFKESLTDPGAAREAAAARRGAAFRQRNQQSLRSLDGQLARLQRSIKEERKQRRLLEKAAAGADKSKGSGNATPQKASTRCARCRCLLTQTDVDAARKQRRDVRLCPVCQAETSLVLRHEAPTRFRPERQRRASILLPRRSPPASSFAKGSSSAPPPSDGSKAPP
jgi:hypothetical protein